jgi:hypothetical protein
MVSGLAASVEEPVISFCGGQVWMTYIDWRIAAIAGAPGQPILAADVPAACERAAQGDMIRAVMFNPTFSIGSA